MIALLRIDRNASDRIGRLIIEDGSKRGTSIGRFPQIARSDSDVPSVGLLGIESDIGDSTCHKGRPDASEFDGADQFRINTIRDGFRCFVPGRRNRLLRLIVGTHTVEDDSEE